MSEWRGLANPDQHDDPDGNEYEAWCCGCSRVCYSDRACYCCLTSEVERLTSAVSERYDYESDLAAEVDRLTAELASRDRRVAEALALVCHLTEGNGCTCLAHQIATILRGESDD